MGCLPSGVAIIGAGLAGTAFALSLHQEGVHCKLYEQRAPDAPELASGVVLTPNGLRVLDALGVFSRITSRCWKSNVSTIKNDRDETTRKTLTADESLYGYKNHRIWRRLLLAEMKLMLTERNIEIEYYTKFGGIIHDRDDEVVFKINDREERSSMLIGADGLYSSVRRYIAPEVVPEYTGMLGMIAHIYRNNVRWPYPDYEPACTIQGQHAAFFIMPEDPEAKEVMVGMQVKHPDQSRAEWEAMSADKDKIVGYFRAGYDEWHDTAKQIIDQVSASRDSLYLWPFMRMPKLDRWFSETGRVIIVGDAAHALPPSSGQGVNQALEDVYSLTLLLKSSSDFRSALTNWQAMRQKRIDAVFEWSRNVMNAQRLPEAEMKRLIAEGKIEDPGLKKQLDGMGWLYQSNLEQDIERMTR